MKDDVAGFYIAKIGGQWTARNIKTQAEYRALANDSEHIVGPSSNSSIARQIMDFLIDQDRKRELRDRSRI